jgi:hypothetical protein
VLVKTCRYSSADRANYLVVDDEFKWSKLFRRSCRAKKTSARCARGGSALVVGALASSTGALPNSRQPPV